MYSKALCAAAASCFALARLASAQEKSLLPDGSFEPAEAGAAAPKAWSALPAGASVQKQANDWNHFLQLKVAEPGKQVMVYRQVGLAPGDKALHLSYRARFTGIEVGAEPWFDGRIMMNFKDAAGKVIKPAPPQPNFKGSSKGWEGKSHKFLVPDGARSLEVMFTLFNAKAGTLEFDDVSLTSIPAAAVEKAVPAAPVPVVPADRRPPELRVQGNTLIDPAGKPVWLQGVSLSGLESAPSPGQAVRSTQVAVGEWKASVVRVPVRETFWFGTGPGQKDKGAAYQAIIEDVINTANARGAYVVIDLHRFRAPEQAHADFWTDVAARYKNHSGVLFELFNEPHDVTWDVWKDGGTVTDKKKADSTALAENGEKLVTLQTIGMQALVDAVRKTGARNIVIVGGLDWSYDLSAILKGYAVDDKGGNGVVYSTHCYPWKSGWQKAFLDVAEKHPLFMGEVGCEVERMPFIPPERHEDPYGWAPDMIATIQKHRINWTAWTFHNRATPRVILDWDYTPTPFWGAFVKAALAGKTFEAKRLR